VVPSLRRRLREARAALRDGGPRAVFVKSLQELRVYRRLGLFEVPLEPRPPRAEPTAAGIRVRALSESPDDLAAYAALRPDAPPGEALDRLRRGDRCFVAVLDGHVVSSVWVATCVARIDYLGCELELGPESAYAYDGYTLPGLRGLDVGSWRTELMKAELRTQGCRRLLSLQLAENRSQDRRSTRRGYRPLGVVGWYGIGSWRRFFVRIREDVGILRVRAIFDAGGATPAAGSASRPLQ